MFNMTQKTFQMEKVCVGRVCCDSNDRLNPSSVLLEGSRGLCYGEAVPLDLCKLTHYSLFPGQIVAVAAVNPTGQRLMVNKLFHSAPLPMPPQLPRFSGKSNQIKTPLFVCIQKSTCKYSTTCHLDLPMSGLFLIFK